MASVIRTTKKKKTVVDKSKLLDRLKEIIACDDLEVIKIALQGLIDEVRDTI